MSGITFEKLKNELDRLLFSSQTNQPSRVKLAAGQPQRTPYRTSWPGCTKTIEWQLRCGTPLRGEHHRPEAEAPQGIRKYYDPTPTYEEGYYESSAARPTATELKLFYHYINMEGYGTRTVGEELWAIQRDKNEEELPNGSDMQKALHSKKYLASLLDASATAKKRSSPIKDLDYSYFVKYDQDRGLNICIQGAFGLPEYVVGYYMHAFGEIREGKETVKSRDQKNLHVVTKRLELSSSQRSPDWLDLKTTLFPAYDEQSVLLVQVFGIKLNYLPTSGGEEGVIQQTEYGSFDIDYKEPLVWSVMPLFDGGYIRGGLHLLAVFKGSPPKELFSRLGTEGPPADVLKKLKAKGVINPEKNSLLEVEMYDGHVESEDLPEPEIDDQIKSLGIKDSAIKSRKEDFPDKFYDIVLKNMDETQPSGPKYEKESFKFQQEANLQFLISMNGALSEVGKAEIPL